MCTSKRGTMKSCKMIDFQRINHFKYDHLCGNKYTNGEGVLRTKINILFYVDNS
jgi:hypothetical protein